MLAKALRYATERTHTMLALKASESRYRELYENVVAGVRVDHVDGLRDPAGYLSRLHSLAPASYVFVEKILERTEELPAGLRAAGRLSGVCPEGCWGSTPSPSCIAWGSMPTFTCAGRSEWFG